MAASFKERTPVPSFGNNTELHRIIFKLRDEGVKVFRLSRSGLRIPSLIFFDRDEKPVKRVGKFVQGTVNNIGGNGSDTHAATMNNGIATLSWCRSIKNRDSETIPIPIQRDLLVVEKGANALPNLEESSNCNDTRTKIDKTAPGVHSEICIFSICLESYTALFEAATFVERDEIVLAIEAGLETVTSSDTSNERLQRRLALDMQLIQSRDDADDEEVNCSLSCGFKILEARASTWLISLIMKYWMKWCKAVLMLNRSKMLADHRQWRLHAHAHKDEDLQAWYHSIFHDELYRLKGPFWYKEAVLQEYSHHPIKKASQEDTPSSVLCTPDMTYSTMAATMYSIRELLGEREYALFENLTASGVSVLKYPRTGRPQKKLFQLSLVQGDMYLFMYLTWKGKHGTQGVELASVDRVVIGIETDVLKRSVKKAKAESFLSLVLPDRSLDLCFDDPQECSTFHSCMNSLVEMERSIRDPHARRYWLVKVRSLCEHSKRAHLVRDNARLAAVFDFLFQLPPVLFRRVVQYACR